MMDGVEQYLRYLESRNYAKRTIYGKKSIIKYFQQFITQQGLISFGEVTAETMESYLIYLDSCRITTNVRRGYVSIIKTFFKYLYQMQQIPVNPTVDVDLPKEEIHTPVVLTEEETEKILNVPDSDTLIGVRDRAILELLYSSGIRRRELINLNLPDLDLAKGYLFIKQGKNRKDRVVPVGETACKAVESYLNIVRWMFVHDPAENAIFLSSESGRRLSWTQLGTIINKYARKSGISKNISTHTLRHTMATHLLQNDADIRYIQAILGHSNLKSTMIYTRIDISDLKEVHRRAHPRGKRDVNSDS